MLLPDNIHPENSIYYNGSIVLETVKYNPELGLMGLYEKTIELNEMSFPTFVLSLDWLYLIDLVKLDDGIVKLCT
jgi:hypothetical protein